MKKIVMDWVKEIREFNESGLSDRNWCAVNKKPYSPSTLRRRIAEYAVVPDLIEIYTPKKDDEPRFVINPVNDASSKSLIKSTEDKVADVISSTRNQLIMHISNFNARELELLLCYAEKILATKEMKSVQKRLEELNRKIRDGYLS